MPLNSQSYGHRTRHRKVNLLLFISISLPHIPKKVTGLHLPTSPQTSATKKQYGKSSMDELFSVAPMMGHTNRHYRFFFGQLSQRAWLYTEMIPANRIVQSYLAASADFFPNVAPSELLLPETIQSHVELLQHQNRNGFKINDSVLDELLHPGPNPAVLQLGGRDPESLAQAATIGAAFGFHAINLNCGCPSTSVSARSTGAALMREPQLVARCLDAMSESMDALNPSTILSVKHRLGVQDVAFYNAESDHAQDDEEAYRTCKTFVQSITNASKVSRIQVHARVALLGKNLDMDNPSQQSLWTPPSSSDTPLSISSSSEQLVSASTKVNHQRVQYQAKRHARQVTLRNRSVPPLRPGVVEQIANDFPTIQVISNGGIDNLDEIQRRIADTTVVGGMVGRAAINHPCSFAAVDTVLWQQEPQEIYPVTRRQVMLRYVEYCQEQESRLESILGDIVARQSTNSKWRKEEESILWHRRRLIAPVFHLFMGEEGNGGYQRRLRKLIDRADRHTTPSILLAAMAEVSSDSLDKPVYDHIRWDDIPKYDFVKRSGAMQRTIY